MDIVIYQIVFLIFHHLPTQYKFMLNSVGHQFTCYNILDKVGSFVIKLTFPLWFIPFLSIILILKIANFWKHVGSIILKMIYPNTSHQLVYALLKGNGIYLREPHESIFTRQFYDYTARRFMGISEFEQESIVVQLQCDNIVGLNYLSQCFKPGNVKGFLSDRKLLKNASASWAQEYLKKSTYQIQSQSWNVDCFLLFNLKSKINFLGKSCVDLIKILEYCRYNLNKQGFIVYGDFFELGQIKSFERLFNAYDLVIIQQEDITKNINYAKKLLSKDRNYLQVKIINYLKYQCLKILGKRSYQCDKSFYVLILENKMTK